MSSNVSREKPVEGILPQACVPIERAFFATPLARNCIKPQTLCLLRGASLRVFGTKLYRTSGLCAYVEGSNRIVQ